MNSNFILWELYQVYFSDRTITEFVFQFACKKGKIIWICSVWRLFCCFRALLAYLLKSFSLDAVPKLLETESFLMSAYRDKFTWLVFNLLALQLWIYWQKPQLKLISNAILWEFDQISDSGKPHEGIEGDWNEWHEGSDRVLRVVDKNQFFFFESCFYQVIMLNKGSRKFHYLF